MYQVEDIMTILLQKSLAQSEYDPILDSYVYNIHNLQLDYLKSQLNNDNEEEKELHRHFLNQYFIKANHDFGKIEDDSYIYYNFGYHLIKSEQFDLFSKVYLDLSFVEAMLKATSSVDLLNDYKRYGEQIIGMVSAF
jgi:chaperonin cofactor prefoldin